MYVCVNYSTCQKTQHSKFAGLSQCSFYDHKQIPFKEGTFIHFGNSTFQLYAEMIVTEKEL
jgi:hypothetical protein